MAKILIPRSDSISAKVIEPSDFESFFSDDIINEYVKSGFTLSAGSGLSVNIAIGKARLKGLFIHNDSASSKGSLSASSTNSIYITLTRDSNSEAESWDFTSNTTGTTPTDSLFIGTATTDGSSVTATNILAVYTKAKPTDRYGNGSLGDVTISSNTQLGNTDSIRQYENLTVNASITLTCGTGSIAKHWMLFATKSIIINGTINLDGRGGSGGAGGGGGSGSVGVTGVNVTTGGDGAIGGTGGAGYNQTSEIGGTNAASGGSGGNSVIFNQASGGGGGGAGISGGTTSLNLGDTDDQNYESIILVFDQLNHWGAGGNGGAGGGGGGGGGIHGSVNGQGGSGGTGGAGGAGGGSVILISPSIIFGTNASITCQGLAGSNGSNGSVGAHGYDYQSYTATGGAGGTGAIVGGSSATQGGNGSPSATGGGGGGGGGATGSSGRNGFVGIIGHNVPSQSDLNSKSTAYKKLRLEW